MTSVEKWLSAYRRSEGGGDICDISDKSTNPGLLGGDKLVTSWRHFGSQGSQHPAPDWKCFAIGAWRRSSSSTSRRPSSRLSPNRCVIAPLALCHDGALIMIKSAPLATLRSQPFTS